MQKIKTLLTGEAGKSRATSLGTLNFDQDTGIAEVDCTVEDAKMICNASPSLTLVTDENEVVKKEVTSPVVSSKPTPPPAPPVEEKPIVKPVTEPAKPESTEPTITSTEGEDIKPTESSDNNEEGEEPSQEELDTLKEVLSEKTMDELRQLCKDSDIDEKEYEEFKGPKGKVDLVDFMVTKRVGL